MLRGVLPRHEYVLISQRERRVQLYRRRESRRWQLDEHVAGDRLRLESLAVAVAVDELHADRVGVIAA
jgi:Uma2 family endonuclease